MTTSTMIASAEYSCSRWTQSSPQKRSRPCIQPLIHNGDHRARTIGVQGVPFFIFNQRYAVSGAQPPDVLLDVMQKASEDVAAAPQ